MKNIYTILCLTLLLVTNKIYSQNETFYVWKNGALIYSQSTNVAVMDSITFKIPSEVRICNQVWSTRNLDVTSYRNGDPIPQVNDLTQWANLTTGAWCYYNNDPANGAIYGKLYNWYAVNDPRGLAPASWHVPSDAEWTILTDCLGGYLVAGGKIKATGTIQAGTGLWLSPNTEATNSSGFNALGGGFCYLGNFVYIGFEGIWWSSSDYSSTFAWGRSLGYNVSGAYRRNEDKRHGFFVRCLRD